MVLLVSIEYLQKVSVGFLHFLRVTILDYYRLGLTSCRINI